MTKNYANRKTKMTVILGMALLAAVFSIATLVPGTKVSASPDPDATGADLFAASCARCHGSDGKGGKGPDLTSEKRQAKWKDSDEKLVKKISDGGMFMPSFGKKLKPEEIKAIADYVRTLK